MYWYLLMEEQPFNNLTAETELKSPPNGTAKSVSNAHIDTVLLHLGKGQN